MRANRGLERANGLGLRANRGLVPELAWFVRDRGACAQTELICAWIEGVLRANGTDLCANRGLLRAN
ncbi:hypothetical protein A374_01629 [Fictibacillus macauensis ZFHKF-1]|uniref:Uncharacterized protein n=1 Tax=Fictibacillus macauensis ZFHKF-1 TaxID=1196324 RepID=I8UJ48_9BACL|nr:hypothetical protein A374_01629 [Fictibacillus macauensis ZFHKF-1]